MTIESGIGWRGISGIDDEVRGMLGAETTCSWWSFFYHAGRHLILLCEVIAYYLRKSSLSTT
jgi:hypothetical protein